MDSLSERFKKIRERTEKITAPLSIEDFVVQPVVDVSPPKWHLGHTTWFFETFILREHQPDYKPFDPDFNYLFNSYYETIGARTLRTDRGNLTRPAVAKILEYRQYVNREMTSFLETLYPSAPLYATISPVLELGLQHEQQHQELLVTDIKYILGKNPLFPPYDTQGELISEHSSEKKARFLSFDAGLYEIGHQGEAFCFDNELGCHQVYLEAFKISDALVTNGEYMEFIEAGGYRNFVHWLADGWDWVNIRQVQAPEYWHLIDGEWFHYTLQGLQKIDPQAAITHISYYEADAYASWKEKRLPTEFEWEVASPHLDHGKRWEWTCSAYLPYPRFKKAPGAIGEYNGKFMVNQMVLRGGSCASPPGHVRKTYRNFFQPYLQWQYTGIRLAENLTDEDQNNR